MTDNFVSNGLFYMLSRLIVLTVWASIIWKNLKQILMSTRNTWLGFTSPCSNVRIQDFVCKTYLALKNKLNVIDHLERLPWVYCFRNKTEKKLNANVKHIHCKIISPYFMNEKSDAYFGTYLNLTKGNIAMIFSCFVRKEWQIPIVIWITVYLRSNT